jgi:hypothetical protein
MDSQVKALKTVEMSKENSHSNSNDIKTEIDKINLINNKCVEMITEEKIEFALELLKTQENILEVTIIILNISFRIYSLNLKTK